MPDLIQVANDLKNMPDAWLAQQMQNPSGSAPPWLVASEVERRQKLRSGAAQAQAPSSSVSQDLIRSLFAKIPPTAGLMPQNQQGPAPPGMPPVNLTPGGGSGALGSPPPGTPPANLRMPARTMAAGGSFDEDDEDDTYDLQPSREEEMASLYPPEEATPSPTGSASREAAPDIEQLVQASSQKYGIAPEVIRSMIHSESSGQRKAVSPKGARGLMQIMPDTAAELGVKDPNQLDDPAINIDTGTRYLRKMLDKYRDLPTALKAYNAGPGAVDKYHGDPPFPETQNYVVKTMAQINGIRKSLNLPPVDQVPANMRSRLLQPTPAAPPSNSPTPYADQVPGGVQMLPPQVAPQPQEPADAVDPAAAPAPNADAAADTTTAPAAAAGAVAPPVKPAPLQQTWEQPESQEITDLKKQVDEFKKGHTPLDQRLKDLYGEDNINMLNTGAAALIGKPHDYSKYQTAIDNVMQIAQKQMHPSIGNALMSFGLALMANKNHNFGVAVGEAGSYAMQSMQALKQQGMKDYLEAAKAGITLQDKMDEYNARIAQYKMQRLGAQQTGVIQDERAWQTQLTGLQRQVNTAQAAFDKATTTPAAQQSAALAILNREGIPLDSKINNPMKQLVATGRTDLVQEAMTMGKGTGAAPKAPPINEQQMESAIRITAQAHNVPLPTNRPATLQDLPLTLHQEANDLYSKNAAQRTIAVQEGIADAATKDLDPTYIGAAIAQTGTLPPGFGRSPLTVAKMWNMGTAWLKANGYTALSAVAARNAAQAAKGALNGLTKTTANVEAFSKLAEANMTTLEGLAAKVKDLGAPVYNTPARDLLKMWGGDARVSDMQVSLATVRAEVARVLNSATASGEINIPAKTEMEKLLGDNYTYAMLKSALNVFRSEMANRRSVYKAELEDLKRMSVVGGDKQETREYNGHTYIKQDGKWVLQP